MGEKSSSEPLIPDDELSAASDVSRGENEETRMEAAKVEAANVEAASPAAPHEVRPEHPAQYARPPRYSSVSGSFSDGTFLREQLDSMYHEFFDEEDEEEFVRESDSEMLLHSGTASVEMNHGEVEPLTPSRRATAWSAIILVVVGFTWFGKTLSNVLAPAALAVFLSYLIVPMAAFFGRLRIPRAVGYALSGALITGFFVAIGALVSASVAEFRSNFERYEQNIDILMTNLTTFARNIGLVRSHDSLQVHELVESLPVGGVTGIISGGASYMLEFIAYFSVTAFFMMFMIWEAERFNYRVRTAYSAPTAERILEVIAQLNNDIQRYVVLKAVVSLLTAALAYVVMRAFSLEFAGVLTLIIFLANFVPYVGSVIATSLPGVVALLQFATWNEAVLLVALITVVQQVLGNIVEPRLQGKSLNLSPLVILFALAYFGWMWGIVGMIVSVPIASGIRLLLEQFEITQPLAKMMRII